MGGVAVRSNILAILRQAQGEYISGEELSRQLGVSRTAIWKHMHALKEEGYQIVSHSRRGYLLEAISEFLLPAEIKHNLATTCLGQEVQWFEQLDSTNNEAKKLAAAGAPEGTVVIAEEQLGGRGRIARGWFSPKSKGIWFSLILRPKFPPYEASKCTLMAAVAVAKAIRAETGVNCGIKWPNDILYQGKKLVGILTEMSAEMDAVNYIVIGCGINVNIAADEFPPELADAAVALASVASNTISRTSLLQRILCEMESCYQEVLQGGFAGVLAAWKALSVTLGQDVEVIGLDRHFSGRAIDLDEQGSLLVQTAERLETVVAGDVSIRPRHSKFGKYA